MGNLNHFNKDGRTHMVSMDEKAITKRRAIAVAIVKMEKQTLERIKKGELNKGDVLAVAQLAAVMASKKTSDIIPLCHNVTLDSANISFEYLDECTIKIIAEVSAEGKTGVEMEAMCAATIAGLTIYDMCKSIDRNIVIEKICLLEKMGGKSGHFIRKV